LGLSKTCIDKKALLIILYIYNYNIFTNTIADKKNEY